MKRASSLLVNTKPYDIADYLETPESVRGFFQVVWDEGDPRLIAKALGIIARSKGMAHLARKTGLTRENLYVTLSEKGNPKLETFLKVLRALDIRLAVVPSDLHQEKNAG